MVPTSSSPSAVPPLTQDDLGRRFSELFTRRARTVRGVVLARTAALGAALGLVVGGAAAGLLWYQRLGPLRPWAGGLAVVGAGLGAAVAWRRRWSNERVALYLDARAGSSEAVTTALEYSGSDAPAARSVLVRAVDALTAIPSVAPRFWLRSHSLALLGVGLVVGFSRVDLPAAPAAEAPPPGVETVRLADVSRLDAVIALEQLDARDEAQAERLRDLAERARKLREDLAQGMPRRQAQDEIAQLRDALSKEQRRLGEGEQRRGLEAAMSQLKAMPELSAANRALGDRDLTRFDEQMRRLAAQLEQQDRERALELLERAAEAAEKEGAKDLAKELRAQKERLAEEGEKLEALRELAEALSQGIDPSLGEALREFEQSPKAGGDRKKLAERLDEALSKLSPEERKRLADRLRKQLADTPVPDGSEPKPKSGQLADALESEQAQRDLERMLKELAKESSSTPGGQRQQGMGDAQRGLGGLQQQLGGLPMPMPSPAGGAEGGRDGDVEDNPSPQSGHSEGGGDRKGSHVGDPTAGVDADDFRAQAEARMNAGAPMPGSVLGRTEAVPGETANQAGNRGLGAAAESEITGVDKSDIPEEYREQVGRYFRPQ